ncbi:Holliday junction resolvase [archaeon]|nr:Holliday junction resolvase [archaeon]
MSKKKGTRAERELFHMLWKNGWAVIRAAGSGSATKPSPDLLASNRRKSFAIECKCLKDERQYIANEDINKLNEFATAFGAMPLIAVRFDNVGWFFFEAKKIPKTKGPKGNYFVVPLDYARKKGLTFEELLGRYKQKRLNEVNGEQSIEV